LAVSPQEAMMVGDSLRADVGGAQPLGMLTVWRRNHPAGKEGHSSVQDGPAGTTAESAHAQPDYVVESLWEVIQLPIFR
ncbi:MAG: HAD hydrolase-like protein, partial [Dehalococcoidia bacterium]